MDIFSNRELATYSWLILITLYAFFYKPMRPIAFEVLSSAFARTLVGVYILLGLYLSLIIFALNEIGLWNIEQLKNTVIWSLTVAISLTFRMKGDTHDKGRIKSIIKDNIRFLLLMEFLISFYSFDFFIEFLVFIPFTFMLGYMLAIAGSKPEYAPVKTLLEFILVALGIALTVHAVVNLVSDLSGFLSMETFNDFYLPPILSIFLIPFLFFISIYAGYERVFLVLSIPIPNMWVRLYAQLRAICAFRFKLGVLDEWKTCIFRHYQNPGFKEVNRSFKEIAEMLVAERNPKKVSPQDGWPPLEAIEFLSKAGLTASRYVRLVDDEWGGSSPYLELHGYPLKNNIGYYVEGTKDAAADLKIILNVNQPQDELKDLKTFSEITELLFLTALKSQMPTEFEEHIMNARDWKSTIQSEDRFCHITITRIDFVSRAFDGYSVKFHVSCNSPEKAE